MKRLRLSGLLLLILCLSLLAIPFWNDRIVRRYIDKIWLHRTNSIEKLHEFEQEYKNFECDVLFLTDSATFEIGHDEPSGEPLKPYLDFLGANPDRELWLDLKNLNESKRDVDKDQLIIESRDWKALHHFTQEGYTPPLFSGEGEVVVPSGERVTVEKAFMIRIAKETPSG